MARTDQSAGCPGEYGEYFDLAAQKMTWARGLPKPFRTSQMRCAPVMAPERPVTAAIIAGQVSAGECSSGR